MLKWGFGVILLYNLNTFTRSIQLLFWEFRSNRQAGNMQWTSKREWCRISEDRLYRRVPSRKSACIIRQKRKMADPKLIPKNFHSYYIWAVHCFELYDEPNYGLRLSQVMVAKLARTWKIVILPCHNMQGRSRAMEFHCWTASVFTVMKKYVNFMKKPFLFNSKWHIQQFCYCCHCCSGTKYWPVNWEECYQVNSALPHINLDPFGLRRLDCFERLGGTFE